MNNILETMISKYQPKNNKDRENAIKEIFQEIALSGLARSNFFNLVGFYGGTCSRIFYGLDRFSEDLDFASLDKNIKINIEEYLPFIEKEFESYGISIKATPKNKTTEVESAFIKANTLTTMLIFYPNSEEVKNIISNQNIKIKLEIDTDNPKGWISLRKFRFLPSPYEITVFDESTVFAGKIHALICREYNNRVKGRDFYDYLFYLKKDTKCNIEYLQNKLINTGKTKTKISEKEIKQLLIDKFNNTNYKHAIDDVKDFIKNIEEVKNWNKNLFLSTIDLLKFN